MVDYTCTNCGVNITNPRIQQWEEVENQVPPVVSRKKVEGWICPKCEEKHIMNELEVLDTGHIDDVVLNRNEEDN